MVIWARMPAALASLAMSSQAAMPSSTLQPWLRWLKLSLAAMAMPISVQPAACARSNPLRLSTRPMKRRRGRELRQRGQHGFGVGHLRHALGIHEARHLDALQAGGHAGGG